MLRELAEVECSYPAWLQIINNRRLYLGQSRSVPQNIRESKA